MKNIDRPTPKHKKGDVVYLKFLDENGKIIREALTITAVKWNKEQEEWGYRCAGWGSNFFKDEFD